MNERKLQPWTITFHDETFTDDDITAGDLLVCQLYVDDGWESANVWKSPLHLLVTTAVIYARLSGDKLADVRAELAAMKFTELPLPSKRTLEHKPSGE